MSIRSYAFTAVDMDGVRHQMFGHATNPGRAAEIILEHYKSYAAVYSAEPGKNFGKPIRTRKSLSAEMKATLLGDAIIQAQAKQELLSAEAANMVIKRIESKGYELMYLDSGNSTEVRAIPKTPDGTEQPLTEEDERGIVEQRDSIIAVLKARPERAPEPPREKKKRAKKIGVPEAASQAMASPPVQTQLEMPDLFQLILPELPQHQSFQTYEIERQLRRQKRHDIVDDKEKLSAFLQLGQERQWISNGIKPGVYRIIHDTPTKPEPTDEAQQVFSSPPQPSVPEVTLSQQLMPTIQNGAVQGLQGLLQGLLTSSLTGYSPGSVADIIDKAFKRFQDAILEAQTQLDVDLMPAIKQLRDDQRVRDGLRDRVMQPTSP